MEDQLLSENHQHGYKITPNVSFSNNLDQSIKQIIKDEGFKKYEIVKNCVSTNGGNYLGELYEVDVRGTTNSGDKELNIFVKIAVKSEIFKIISIDEIYMIENFAYKELSQIFEDLQEKANIPIGERYKMVKAYEETNAKEIILENVSKIGYTTYNRTDTMSLTFMELCVKQLARFHALSFIIKEKKPKFFFDKIKPLKYPMRFGKTWKNMCSSLKKICLEYTDEAIRDKVEKAFDNVVVKYDEYANDETIKVCLCHGDYRHNNIMTNFNIDGEPTDIIPVDYQIMHYGCPAFDFLYLIYCCTDRKFRQAHTSYLKDLYYETFRQFLGYFELDADVIYARDEFEKVYEGKLDYGLIIALTWLPFILASETDVPKRNQEKTELSFKVNDTFKNRVNDAIADYVEWL